MAREERHPRDEEVREELPTPQPGLKSRLRAKARKKARRRMRRVFVRRKMCRFCADSNLQIDYKDPKVLRFFITETGKLIPRRISGNCARHQREVTVAIKRSRILALLPYTAGAP